MPIDTFLPPRIYLIHSWFGLVNQVSNYAQLQDIMTSFKPLVSPRCPFTWTPELDQRFLESKGAIIEAKKRVKILDKTKRRPTVKELDTSFPRSTSCESKSQNCYEDGWKITLAGSRFLHSAVNRYAHVEGEALGVAWGLEQTKYFTQGCDNLLVMTDHKPLLKLLGDHTPGEIINPRLFRLKQRILPWRYDIAHTPGIANKAADATSRHPISEYAEIVSLSLMSFSDRIEYALNVEPN